MIAKPVNVAIKSVLSTIAVALCLTPIWLIVIAKVLLQPEGFWQKAALYGLGFYLLAGFQIVLLIACVMVVVMIWVYDS